MYGLEQTESVALDLVSIPSKAHRRYTLSLPVAGSHFAATLVLRLNAHPFVGVARSYLVFPQHPPFLLCPLSFCPACSDHVSVPVAICAPA